VSIDTDIGSLASEARAFLEFVFEGKPESLQVRLWISEYWDEPCWLPNVDAAAYCAQCQAERDVYIGLGLANEDCGATEGCGPAELAALAGISIDIGLRSYAHPQATRPQTVEQAISILPPELPPTCVVDSGDSVQVCWLFQEPYVFASELDRRQTAGVLQRWTRLLRGNARIHGWAIDPAASLDHLLRVPGTTNCTDPDNPKSVTVYSRIDRRYSLSELIEYLDDQGVPDPAAKADARQEWGERLSDKPLAINLAARIPEDLLKGWLTADEVFKSTWFHHRSDLPDQSQLQYDLALGRFGVSADLTEQQIVDLIIHNRAMHKRKARTTLDYYYRTLAKASDLEDVGKTGAAGPPRESAEESAERAPRPEVTGLGSDANSSSNSDMAKIALCDGLSKLFGVEILRIVKLSGQNPAYRIELAQGKAHFDNVGKFISQSAVRSAIAARLGKLIPDFKPKQWKRIAQDMLDACIVEDGGPELEADGEARMYLSQYLEESEFILQIADQTGATKRKPMVRQGRITVCASDLQSFINLTTHQGLSPRAVAAMLSAIGAASKRVRGKGFKEQGRWVLPISEFDPADYRVPKSDSPRSGEPDE
jgi:hypothetical protein